MIVARVTGIALIALGVALLASGGTPLVGMLTYSAAATWYLAYVGFGGRFHRRTAVAGSRPARGPDGTSAAGFVSSVPFPSALFGSPVRCKSSSPGRVRPAPVHSFDWRTIWPTQSCITSRAARRSNTRPLSPRCIPHATLFPRVEIFHAAGPSAGGWTIVAVHESKASWEQFRDGTLRPAFEKGIGGSFYLLAPGIGVRGLQPTKVVLKQALPGGSRALPDEAMRPDGRFGKVGCLRPVMAGEQ